MADFLTEKLEFIKKNPGCTYEEIKQHIKQNFERHDFDEFFDNNMQLSEINDRFSVRDGKYFPNGKGDHLLENIKSYQKRAFLKLISDNVKNGLHVLATLVTISAGLIYICFALSS